MDFSGEVGRVITAFGSSKNKRSLKKCIVMRIMDNELYVIDWKFFVAVKVGCSIF